MSVATPSKHAIILMKSVQHQINYCLTKTHVDEIDFNGYKSKQLTDLYYDKNVYKTYDYIKFTTKGGKDICRQTDAEMKTSKDVGTYVGKEYSPMAFSIIRKMFGITNEHIINSICSEDSLTPPVGGAGKSGSMFMFTKDKQFILKVIPKREAKIVSKTLQQYLNYIRSNSHTLMPKFYGMFRVKPKGDEEYRYLVMNNLFPNQSFPIHLKYDLKGSRYGRKANSAEQKKKSPCFKDLDFLDKHESINLGPLASRFKEQVASDSRLLAEMHLIDYSLLVGIHNLSDEEMSVVTQKLNEPPVTSTPEKKSSSHKKHHKHHKNNDKKAKGDKKNKDGLQVVITASDNNTKASGKKTKSSKTEEKIVEVKSEQQKNENVDTKPDDKDKIVNEKTSEGQVKSSSEKDLTSNLEKEQEKEGEDKPKEDEQRDDKQSEDKQNEDEQKDDKQSVDKPKEDEQSVDKQNEEKQEDHKESEVKQSEEKPKEDEQKDDKQSEDKQNEDEQKDEKQSVDKQSEEKQKDKKHKDKKQKDDKEQPKEIKEATTENKKDQTIDESPEQNQPVAQSSEKKETKNKSRRRSRSSRHSLSSHRSFSSRHSKTNTSEDSDVDVPKKTKSKSVVANTNGFIDYLNIPRPEKFIFEDYENGLLGRNGDGTLNGILYYLGVIDILMDYTARKKVETVVKGVAAGGQEEVSSVSPEVYSERFITFVQENVK
ncbi:Cylicin-2 [Entamoeba marina]